MGLQNVESLEDKKILGVTPWLLDAYRHPAFNPFDHETTSLLPHPTTEAADWHSSETQSFSLETTTTCPPNTPRAAVGNRTEEELLLEARILAETKVVDIYHEPAIYEIYSYLNLNTQKSNVRVMGGVKFKVTYIGSNILSTHIPFVACQSTLHFLRYSFCRI